MTDSAPASSLVLRFSFALSTDVADGRAKVDAFCEALERSTSIHFVPTAMDGYEALFDAIANDEVDICWAAPAVALRALAAGRIEPLALPVRHGFSSYDAALICRPDAPFERLRDLKSVRVGWVDKHSASGYLVMRAWLQEQGLEPWQAFAEERFLATHDAVTAAVLAGEVDVGATFVNLAPLGTTSPVSAGWRDAKVKILARTGPIAADLIAAVRAIPRSVVEILREALLDDGSEARQAACALLDAEDMVPSRNEYQELLQRLGPWLAKATMPPPPL